MVQWQKYLTCWPLAAYLRQESMPAVPDGILEALGGSNLHFPLRGKARKHFRNLLASRPGEVRPSRVCWAILQGVKRGTVEVPEDFILLTMAKHQRALTQALPELSAEHAEQFRRKFRAIWREHREVRAGGKTWHAYGVSKRMRHFADLPPDAGYNACFESTRAEGGRCAFVRNSILDYLQQEDFFGSAGPEGQLIRMTEVKPGVVVEERADANFLPTVTRKLATKLGLRDLRASHGRCAAEVAGILEPLKCRLITKGSGLVYWSASSLQRALWERLQDHRCFRLTGRPLDMSDLVDVDRLTGRLGLERFTDWVSGDYSAATDGLSQSINRLCLEEAIAGAGLDDDEAEVARAVLGNHKIYYPPEYRSELPLGGDITQANGQLMGSVLSFPVLCAINVAAYWLALEEYLGGAELPLSCLPVLVNGDDICFKANAEFYAIWQRWTTLAGFTLSPGKNYISSSFVTINSEGFVSSQRPGRAGANGTAALKLQKVDFLNTGLLYAAREREVDWREPKSGGRRPGSGDKEKRAKVGLRPENREMPFTAKVNRVVRESCDPKRTLLRVHEFYRDEIAYHTHRGEINMHAAPELGGLGIALPEGCETRFTPWQQKVAGYLRNKWKSLDFGSKIEVDGEMMWDLNAPMRVEGRCTYQRATKPCLIPHHPVKPGRVVVRAKLEPCRADEVKWSLPSSGLLNYQAERSEDRGEWKIRQLSSEDLGACRAYEGERVSSPLEWHDELRVQLPPGQSLNRTDSCSGITYSSPDGEVFYFRTKPILVGP
nr:MAG: putative RNA-dependent RNA polymerase [Narnaviridae sp.]